MLKMKLQNFGHMMGRTDSFENILILGRIEGGRRRGWQRMRWLDGITDSMDMILSKSGSWWWTGRPGVLQSMGLQRVEHYWVSELKWTLLDCLNINSVYPLTIQMVKENMSIWKRNVIPIDFSLRVNLREKKKTAKNQHFWSFPVRCWNQLASALEDWLLDIQEFCKPAGSTSVACSQPWWEYLHYGNW